MLYAGYAPAVSDTPRKPKTATGVCPFCGLTLLDGEHICPRCDWDTRYPDGNGPED